MLPIPRPFTGSTRSTTRRARVRRRRSSHVPRLIRAPYRRNQLYVKEAGPVTEFTVKPGEALDLGDMVTQKRPVGL